VLLQRSGFVVVAAAGRSGTRARVRRHLPDTRFVRWADASGAAADADVVVLGVPDDLVATTCTDLAERGSVAGRWVLHLSGALTLAALEPAAKKGARVLSFHPLQSIPDVQTGVARLPGSAVAVSASSRGGVAFGRRLARAIGGRPVTLPDGARPLYHAAAVFCSNYLLVLEALAEDLFRVVGIPRPREHLAPLARATIETAVTAGPRAGLTGPAERGDAGTVRRNLEALAAACPDAVEPYVALARVAARLAADSGTDADRRAAVDRELARWR
jgi:predicted short-subunit dehydrogenase-like oxidoreductase (DUF2520 family)